MKEITSEILDKKYFIFDIDGTLVDSMGMWTMVDQITIYNISGQLVDAEEIKAYRDSVLYAENNIDGNIYDLFYAEAVKHYGLGVSAEEYKKARHDLARRISINELDFKPGADSFLKILKMLGKKIGITTTTTRDQYEIYSVTNEKMVSKAPLREIADVVVACEDVVRKKPDPEAYLKTVEKLGAKKGECIVFEDSLSGIIAARDAGLEVVAVYDDSAKNEQYYIEQVADYMIDSFDELIKAIGLESMCSKI